MSRLPIQQADLSIDTRSKWLKVIDDSKIPGKQIGTIRKLYGNENAILYQCRVSHYRNWVHEEGTVPNARKLRPNKRIDGNSTISIDNNNVRNEGDVISIVHASNHNQPNQTPVVTPPVRKKARSQPQQLCKYCRMCDRNTWTCFQCNLCQVALCSSRRPDRDCWRLWHTVKHLPNGKSSMDEPIMTATTVLVPTTTPNGMQPGPVIAPPPPLREPPLIQPPSAKNMPKVQLVAAEPPHNHSHSQHSQIRQHQHSHNHTQHTHSPPHTLSPQHRHSPQHTHTHTHSPQHSH